MPTSILDLRVALSCLAVAASLAQIAKGVDTPPPKKLDSEVSLPARVAAIKDQLKGQNRAAMQRILTEELGEPTRQVGSGELRSQWDVAGGVLSFPPAVFEIGGRRHWLVDTRNAIGANLTGSWEMTTSPGRYGNRFWIGGVELKQNGTYAYSHQNANPREQQAQVNNFFIQNPKGKFAIEYPKGLEAKSLLETLTKENTPVAMLVFTAEGQGGRMVAKFVARSGPSSRMLEFSGAAGEQLMFCLEKGWEDNG